MYSTTQPIVALTAIMDPQTMTLFSYGPILHWDQEASRKPCRLLQKVRLATYSWDTCQCIARSVSESSVSFLPLSWSQVIMARGPTGRACQPKSRVGYIYF